MTFPPLNFQHKERVICTVYSHNLECVYPNGYFLNILFTETDESWKTFPKNQLPKVRIEKKSRIEKKKIGLLLVFKIRMEKIYTLISIGVSSLHISSMASDQELHTKCSWSSVRNWQNFFQLFNFSVNILIRHTFRIVLIYLQIFFGKYWRLYNTLNNTHF